MADFVHRIAPAFGNGAGVIVVTTPASVDPFVPGEFGTAVPADLIAWLVANPRLTLIGAPTPVAIAGFAGWMVVVDKQTEAKLRTILESSSVMRDFINLGGGGLATNGAVLSAIFIFMPVLQSAFLNPSNAMSKQAIWRARTPPNSGTRPLPPCARRNASRPSCARPALWNTGARKAGLTSATLLAPTISSALSGESATHFLVVVYV